MTLEAGLFRLSEDLNSVFIQPPLGHTANNDEDLKNNFSAAELSFSMLSRRENSSVGNDEAKTDVILKENPLDMKIRDYRQNASLIHFRGGEKEVLKESFALHHPMSAELEEEVSVAEDICPSDLDTVEGSQEPTKILSFKEFKKYLPDVFNVPKDNLTWIEQDRIELIKQDQSFFLKLYDSRRQTTGVYSLLIRESLRKEVKYKKEGLKTKHCVFYLLYHWLESAQKH
eukprot:GHVP01062116.1.p1 GENE.GHVP01062116.1~~GHVP01062116.1.p1  ORF type:complete len:229 (+),score=44.19 GHVP01062116.1:38-724(+)